jgi:hypothetical protein
MSDIMTQSDGETKDQHRLTTNGPRCCTSLQDGDQVDSLTNVRSEQRFDFVFECPMSSNDFVEDDMDNDSIEIARNRKSAKRTLKKQRVTSDNVKRRLRELREKMDAPIKSQHLKGLAMDMHVSLCSNF